MPFTILDVVVIIVVLFSATLAMVRGFVRETLSIASWVAAAVAAYFFYGPLVPFVTPYIANTIVATIVAASVVFFVALIVASYITMRISDFVIDSRIGAVDRLLGFGFGVVRGVLLMVVVVVFFDFFVPDQPSWIAQARTKPYLNDAGNRLMAALPEDLEATLLKRLRRGDSDGDGEAPAGGEPSTEGGDLGSGAREGLDQLIENTGSNQQ